MKTGDVCRKRGISEATFYNGKSKYGGFDLIGSVPRPRFGHRAMPGCGANVAL